MTRSIQGASVAVVGAAGFLGSHLVEYLIEERGCKVIGLDNLVAGRREYVHPKCEFYHIDITGSEMDLAYLFLKHKVRFVLNYAAWPYIPDSFSRPLQVFNVNAFGAMKVINAAQEAGVEAILQVSSAEIYGEGQYKKGDSHEFTNINEDASIAPHSTYGASKAAIDAWIRVRWKEAKTPCIALRQFNCVGERETHPYVVPEIITQLYQTGNRLSLGNDSVRDFLYAGDAVRSAVELLEKGDFGEVYNLGSEQGVRISKLAQMLSDIVGCGRVEITQDPARVRPWEIWHLQSDNRKINNTISYRPKVSLEEAFKKTVDWYVGNGKKWSWE